MKDLLEKIIGKHVEHWYVINVILILYDIFAIGLAYFLALWLRFDLSFDAIPKQYLLPYYQSILIYAFLCIIVFWLLKLYRSIWRFASFSELLRMMIATVITFLLNINLMLRFFTPMPISYYIFGIILQFCLTLGIRFSYRFILLLRGRKNRKNLEVEKRIMIIGAGAAGQLIARDIRNSEALNERVYCFIDDNPNKQGRYIDDAVVFGNREDILKAANKFKIEKIYVAIPSASAADKRELLNICNETNCEVYNLPGMYQFAKGELSVSKMKKVAVEDLLGRDPIKPDMTRIFEQLKGKVVLVTGGGGSIGSELCRQIASHEPKQLIIFDIYENNAYDIQLELKEKYPTLNLVTLIGSVRDSRRVFQIFETYHPNIVYHAAAHKHVPLMEESPCEAIKNNTIGTYKTAYAAMVHGCDRFVLISTDKAVNPTNQMGASKRTCEMICQSFDKMIKNHQAEQIPELFTHFLKEDVMSEAKHQLLANAHTEYVAVRFGNVLGSNGSVIPIFKKQIKKGGPVTVTHPDIIRYFMTIPEAVGLVLTAGSYAKGGEIFVLDMGEPVKIDTMARNLIRLSGYTPDVDIKIEYTGLRPGEKLYEEKLMAEEGLKKTENKLIHIGCPIPFDEELFLSQLEKLMDAAYNNHDDIKHLMQKVVSTYHPMELE